MVWISSIRGARDGLQVERQQLDGSKTLATIASAAADLQIPGAFRRKVRLDLTTLRPACTSSYLEALGRRTWEPGAQCTYEASVGNDTLVISTQLLVIALMAARSCLRDYLLTPGGPTLLSTVIADEQVLRVIPTRHMAAFRGPSVTDRLYWMLAYPSARAAWCSVYREALDGRFDMQLPKAAIDAVVWVLPAGKKLLATRLTVVQLQPLEAPFEFAGALARRDFEFHSGSKVSNTHGKAAAPASDDRLQATAATGPLTDVQWAQIEPKVREFLVRGNGGAPRAHSLRTLLDVMLLKLGTPYSWSKVPAPKELSQSASVLFSKLQRGGLWEQVLQVLEAP